jgi:hypothetical protein
LLCRHALARYNALMNPTPNRQIADIGKALYEAQVRSRVELPENVGKIVALDTQSADFELDTDLLTAGDRLRERHPNAAIWFTRVGYKTAFAVGGALTRG